MKKYKISLVNKSMALGLIIWLTLGAGLGTAQTSGRLTLSLQPSLNSGGDIKATSITKAVLLGPDGAVDMKIATITGGSAQFNLSGVQAGDYFIRVNDLADDLVPTRIDDPTKDVIQSVGQKLRVTVIGSLSDPTYRIKTFSKGQGEHPVVMYSDGTNLTPERYAYVILSLKTSPRKFEVRILGSTRVIPTASEINNFTPSTATHPSTSNAVNPPFSTWMFSESDHADDYNGNDSRCNTCHGNLDTKPATFSEITINSGWCFRCHYGKGGIDKGLIDTTSLPAATQTTVIPTQTVTTAKPATTPKAPAFEALFSISALLMAIVVRRR